MRKIKYLIVLFICFFAIPGIAFAGELNITAIDFGSKGGSATGAAAIGVEGDSVLLESKGNYLLMDSGNYVADNRVVQYLKNHNVKKLSLYLSHPHNDHYGRLQTIIEDNYFTVEKLYMGNLNWYTSNANKINQYPNAGWAQEFNKRYQHMQALIGAANSRNVQIVYLNTNSTFSIGDASAKVLLGNYNSITMDQYCTMDMGYTCRDRNECYTLSNCPSSRAGHYLNNTSLVTMITIDNRSFLTAGDIEGYRHKDKNGKWDFLGGKVTPEETLINMHNNGQINLKAEIFKLSHHGIWTSNMSSVTNPNFVEYVDAPYVFYQNEHDNVNQYAPWGKSYDTTASAAIWWQDRIVDSESRSNVFSPPYNGSTTFNIKNGTIIAYPERNYISATVTYKNTYGTTLQTRKFNFNKAAPYHIRNYAPNRSGYKLKSPSTVTSVLSGGPTSSNVSKTVLYEATSKYNVQLKFNMNGGSLASQHSSNISTSGQWITRLGSTIVQTLQFGQQFNDDGLVNYNNSSYINITRNGYKAKSNSEWNTQADGKGKSFSQSSVYQSDNFCSAATGNCTTNLYVNWEPINYTITYNLNGGKVSSSNPTGYNIESNNIVLNNPTKTGYSFTGWTGSNGSTPQTSVTLAKGSYGNKSYAANWNANTYTITFDSNGGSSVNPISAAYGSDITKPTNPTKAGHIFAGWYTEPELTNVFEFDTMPSENITLYAKWIESGQKSITYVLNGGQNDPSNPASYIVGDEIDLEPATRTGYTFQGWYTESDFTNKIERITSDMNKNLTLYAKWKINSYTITFNSNGGSSVSPIEANYNATITKPTNPTKTGYTFDGWYSDSALTTEFTFNKMPAQNTTLYAKWTPKNYTITFDSNGGSSVSPISGAYGSAVTEPSAPTFEGYTFAGWYSDAALTEAYTFTTMPAKNMTLYAKWTANTYRITFDSNGGSSVAPIEALFEEHITKPTNPTKDGFTFIGWYSDSALTNRFEFDTMPAENITLYARWAVDTNTVTFETNGGSSLAPTVIETGDKLVRPSNPTKTGHTFDNWYSDSNLTTLYDFNTPVTSDITIYAKWNVNQYTVSYNTNGGTSIPSVSVDYGTSVPRPADPTKTGYTFSNWQLDGDDYTFGSMPNHDIVLTAKWTPNTYTITFDSNGGSSVSPISGAYGSNISEPTDPDKEGYIFAGWYSDQALTSLYTFSTMPSENITLYAKWVEGANIINYELDYGVNDPDNPSSYVTGTEVTLKDPTKEGCEFQGWYLDSAYTRRISKITSSMHSDITLYAKWRANTYTITFNSNGGSNVPAIEASYGSVITKPTDPVKENSSFAGWYSNPELTELYVFDTMPSRNITLYAKWGVMKYTITFESNGGSLVNPITEEKNTPIREPNSPYRDGYRFAGWYSNPQLTKLFTFDIMPSENITLYAKWVNNNTRVIDYDLDGGINDISNPTSYIAGQEIVLKPAKKDGYEFMGWYLDKDYKTKVEKITVDMNKDVTLYARFVKPLVVDVPNTGVKLSIIVFIGLLLTFISIYKISNILGVDLFEKLNIKK